MQYIFAVTNGPPSKWYYLIYRNVDWELLRELEDGFKFPGGKVSELTPLAHLAARQGA